MAVAKPQAIAHGWIVLPNRAQIHFFLGNTALSRCSQQKTK